MKAANYRNKIQNTKAWEETFKRNKPEIESSEAFSKVFIF